MKIKVRENLYFGDDELCKESGVVIHACKYPCYVKNASRNNLYTEIADNLFLNIIDPEEPLFLMKTFKVFLDFVDRKIPHNTIHIHCNKGMSRSPSLALLYIGKQSNMSYKEAFDKFNFPYNPSRGISLWLSRNWDKI